MSDSLSLSLWYSSFPIDEMLARVATIMRLFPFSELRPGVTYLAVHPVSWSEPTVLERRFQPGIRPEEAALLAADLLHEDYAYVFEAAWDLWAPAEDGSQWILRPSPVRFLVHGLEFEDAAYEQNGHIQVDFGLDSQFLQEDVDLTSDAEIRVRANVQALVKFTQSVEASSGASGRLLWSESEENLAQKLVARLQKTQ